MLAGRIVCEAERGRLALSLALCRRAAVGFRARAGLGVPALAKHAQSAASVPTL